MSRLRKILILIAFALGASVWWVLHEVASLDEIDWDLAQ